MTKEICQCRFCDSTNIKDVIDFGNVALANALLTVEEATDIYNGDKKEFQPRLAYFICEDCGAFQMKDWVDPNILFKNYLYSSSTSGNLVAYFKQSCEDLIKRFELDKDSFVVVIASNDGIELRNFVEAGIPCLGVEPSNLANVANTNGYPTRRDFFTLDVAKDIVAKRGKATLVIANNVMAHLGTGDNYKSFIQGVEHLLAANGVFTFENSYHGAVIDNNLFDLWYHEHSASWSLSSVGLFLMNNGMRLFDVDYTSPHGGSFRAYSSKPNACWHSSYFFINELFHEKRARVHKLAGHEKFLEEFYVKANRVRAWVEQTRASGKTVAAWGCPAKFVLMAKVFGLEDLFEYVVDDSPIKQGKYTPGSLLPIVSSEYAKANPTDVMFVTAWNFFDLIVDKNNWYEGEWINPSYL